MPAVLALTGGTVHGGQRRGAGATSRPPTSSPARSSPPWRTASSPSSARFPAFAAGQRVAFVEVARRHGDYAVCGLGAVVTIDATAS